jgi:hypothetical protein
VLVQDIIEFTVSELLQNDQNNMYRSALSDLSKKYSKLEKWKTASKRQIDKEVLDATKIVIDAILQVDSLMKQANFDKNASFITKIMIKTLKIAQKILAALLVTSPLKVGIAYNAMHNVIKYLEKSLLKKEI